MLFAVLFEDAQGLEHDPRREKMPDHLAFLEQNAEAIKAAGPLFDETVGAGGLWLVDAADRDAVDRLVKADPFWPTGLRKSVRILEWRQVFSDGARRRAE